MPRNIHPTPFVIHPSNELGKNIDLRNLSRNLASKYADGHVVTDDDLQIMGRNLWNGLSAAAQGAFEAARKEAGEKILPVVIHSDVADVQALPWETLFHPTYGFIGKKPGFTLTRRSSAQEATGGLDQGPLRVLLFTSLPANVDPERSRLKVEEEQAEVQAALLPWIAQGLVMLEMPDDGRFFTLQNLLKEFQPHVLFLSGHGNFHHMPHANEAYGEFFFEDEAGDSVGIKEEEIADALRGTSVQAVILSACESGKAASDELSNGLTRKISAAGISHVIGMREAIYDVAGIQFARALCDSLARQERMDVALQAARIAIQTPFKDVARASSSIGDELSYGQWCLPLLISSAPSRALIDWDFTPRQVEARAVSQKINTVAMPARFIGRRAEMRKYKNSLLAGKIHSLMITGPGGQGKTSLAGKLALDLQAHGYRLFAWSARPENSWRDFELEMEQTLDRPRVDRYDKFLPRAENESARAQFMLDLLMEQFDRRVVLFLDNLETIQDPDTLSLKDATVEAWLGVASQIQGMILLVTSRWQIPDWNGEHEPLTHVNYGDFLQIAQKLSLPPVFLTRRNSLRQVYDILGGNVRGLEFFAAAVRDMENVDEENAFLEKLSTVKEDLQANMAIEAIYNRLPANAQTLLHRLPAFHEPVPMEGLLKLAPDLPNSESLLERLLAVSLLEASYEPHWNVNKYQCPQMVADWMRTKGLVDDGHEWLNVVADYHLRLHNEWKTLKQAITTHHALRRAERHDEADQLTLGVIVNPLKLAGFYSNLLNDWLPRVCDSRDLVLKASALNTTGLLHQSISNYDKALTYLKESLSLTQQCNQKEGEGSILNNIGFNYDLLGDYETASTYFQQAVAIHHQFNDKESEAASLDNIGALYHKQGDHKKALVFFEQSLKLFREIGNHQKEGTLLNNISLVFMERGDYATALSYLKQSLFIRQRIGDKAGENTTLNNIGEIYRLQGDFSTSLTYFKQSLVICQEIGDRQGEGALLNNISQIFERQGDYATALSYLKQSLVIQQKIGDKKGIEVTLCNIGAIFYAHGDYRSALTHFERSLAICQEINDLRGQGTSLNNISQIFMQQGDYATALSYLNQSLAIQQQIGDKKGLGMVLGNIANIYKFYSNYAESISYLNKALVIFRQIEDVASEGTILEATGEIYRLQGSYEIAIDYLKQSLAICQKIGDLSGQSTTLNSIALIHHMLGEYGEAVSCFQEALIISQQVGNKIGEGIVLNNIGTVYRKSGDYKSAFLYYKKSLVLQKETADKVLFCQILFNLGHIHVHNNQKRKAVSAWTIAYITAKQINMTQVLLELSKLAFQFDMPEGLDGWEQLARHMQNKDRQRPL